MSSTLRITAPGQVTQVWTFDARTHGWRQTAGGPAVRVANVVVQNVPYKTVFLSRKLGLTTTSARVVGSGSALIASETGVANTADPVGGAWAIEQRRVALRHGHLWDNRIARDVAAMALVYVVIAYFAGGVGLGLFLAQCAIGIVVLELFNYIAHYGLRRQPHQPFNQAHSWNSSNALANALIFNMGRHSWHHARPAASYESLKFVATAPELPAGYAGSILMALVPFMWRRVMDPAVQKLHTAASNASV